MAEVDDYADVSNFLPESFYVPSGFTTPDVVFDEEWAGRRASALARMAEPSVGALRAFQVEDQMVALYRTTSPIPNDKGVLGSNGRIKVREVLDIETIEKKSEGSLLGEKVKITFVNDSGDSKGEEEDIDTGWIDYFGFGSNVLEISLSRSILAAMIVARERQEKGDRITIKRTSIDKTVKVKDSRGKMTSVKPRWVTDCWVPPSMVLDSAILAQNLEALYIAMDSSVGEALDYLADDKEHGENLLETYAINVMGAAGAQMI